MAETISVMLTNWIMIIRTVVSSMRTNAEAIAAVLEPEIYPDDPQGRVKEDILARARLLERKLAAYRKAARALADERGDDAVVDVERKNAVDELNDLVIETRSLFASAHPPEILTLIGLSGPTPGEPDALEEYAAKVRDNLRKKTLPAPGRGIGIDVPTRATMLDEALTRVARAQEAFAQEGREEQSALSDRNRAEADLRRTYAGVTSGFVADAVLAGRNDIADRVRPTANRRKGLPEEVDREVDVESEDDGADRERELVTGDES